MSKEKQIEGMAKVIKSSLDGLGCGNFNFTGDEISTMFAKTLYEKGYRKQSEGEWKKHGNEKTCSLCKFIYYSNNDEWNYCPNCGARMKGV